jgi:hypothetical protein
METSAAGGATDSRRLIRQGPNNPPRTPVRRTDMACTNFSRRRRLARVVAVSKPIPCDDLAPDAFSTIDLQLPYAITTWMMIDKSFGGLAWE